MKATFFRKSPARSFVMPLAAFCGIFIHLQIAFAFPLEGESLDIGSNNILESTSQWSATIGDNHHVAFSARSLTIGTFGVLSGADCSLIAGQENSASGLWQAAFGLGINPR